MKISKIVAAGLVAISMIGLAAAAKAAPIIVNSGSFFATTGGVGGGRGQGIKANSTFAVDSIGIHANLNAGAYDVVIYSSTDGHSNGSQLAIGSANLTAAGYGWYDVAINYTFNAGSFYVVNFRPQIGNFGSGTVDYYNDAALPVTIGPLTLIDGFDGFGPTLNGGNSLDPNFRYDLVEAAVPAPGALALLGLGLFGIGGLRRKMKAA